MNKVEYLDMLKDYLMKYYSEEEIFEILRDYEEYFVNGKLDGKTDSEIILELGSPKKIVLDLIEEDGVEKNDLFSNLKDRFYKWYDRRFFEKVQKKSSEIVDEGKTVVKRNKSTISFIFTNILLLILHFIMFCIVMTLVCFLISMVLLTIAGVVTAIVLTPVTINGLSFLTMSYAWIIFPILLAIGLFILMSILIYYFSKFLYKFILEYINWVKVQMMYKRAENNSLNIENKDNGEV